MRTSPNRWTRIRRAERGQSALVECAMLLPVYVILIFGITTFGQTGLLRKKAIFCARYIAFGGTDSDAKKNLRLDKWEEVNFGQQEVKVTLGATTTIDYTPMKIMIKATGGGGASNPFDPSGGLDEKLQLADTYSVDGS